MSNITVRTFGFPLSSGVMTATIPTPMSSEDFDLIIETLKIWKPNFIHIPKPLGWEYDEIKQKTT